MTAIEEAIEEFTQRRGELEADVTELGRLIAHWDQLGPSAGRGPSETRLREKGLVWANDLRALKTATLARAAGDAIGSREWVDDAYNGVFQGSGIYSDWDLDTERIDPHCAASGVHQLVLCPAVMRKDPEPDVPFDAIVELQDGVAVDSDALERIGHELSRQMGRAVEVFVYDELSTKLPSSIAIELLNCGVCIYHDVQETED